MAKITFKLDHAGIAAILKGDDVGKAIDALGSKVAALAGGDAKALTTDRRISVVRVKADRQARDGALTRAASAAGLEVKPRKGRS
jgi:hypothetical protein